MKIRSPYLIKPHTDTRLSKLSSSDTGDFKSEESAAPVLLKHRNLLSELQDVFYANQSKALLIVLQGMDTAGKDGAISHIFSGVNPQGCDVASFKVPTPLEARHDFLWRAHAQVPPRGMFGIFNRSHYEDVLSPRVHKLISNKTMQRRLDNINGFEEMLADNDVLIRWLSKMTRSAAPMTPPACLTPMPPAKSPPPHSTAAASASSAFPCSSISIQTQSEPPGRRQTPTVPNLHAALHRSP